MRKANNPALLPYVVPRTVLPGVLLSLLVWAGEAKGQCTSTGPIPGTIFTTESGSSGLPFSAAANAGQSDNHYAFAQPLVALEGEERTHYLKATGFNFSIPSHAEICGVTVHILKRASGVADSTTVSDEEVRLLKGGTLTGLNKRSTVAWSSDLVTESYGGDASYWGTSLTPADLNDPRFGVALAARMESPVAAYPRVEIDQVSIEVTYQLRSTSPQYVEAFTASLEKNIVSCEWTVTTEEKGSRMILQQSLDNRQWKDLATYSITSDAQKASYRQVSRLETKGNYYYRIKLISREAETTFSNTARVHYASTGEPRLYPTSARSMVYLENVTPNDKIQVFSLNNTPVSITTVQVKESMMAIRVNHLPKGMYIVKVGRSTLKFIKE